MSAVNLDTYSLSLLAAKEDVLSSRRSTDWAIFTYEKRNDLKLSDSGAGGLEELARKFTPTSLLYALCQVKDCDTGRSHIILINWVGEKVDDSYRQTCAAHLPAIKAFFKEASIIISTRRADEVTSEAIHNVLSSLSPAGSASRKSRLADSEELVGTNYRKTNPAMEMRRSKRDSFWAQAEREEEERKEEERRRLQDERKRWDRERMEQEKREADERDRKISEKEFMIEEQRKEQARVQAEERKKEKTKWEEQQKEHEAEMRDRFRRSESIEKAAEAAVLVSQRSLNPREYFRQRENSVSSSSSPSPTSPTAGGARRPALRYQRSLTESSYMNRKPEPPTSPSATPSPSYTRRQEFFASMSPRTPPETCSPSMIFSKAGAPTRGGRFPFLSPPRVGAQPPKPFTRADSLPATSLTHSGSLRPSSPPNSKGFSPTGLLRQAHVSSPPPVRHEVIIPASPPRVNSLSPTSQHRDIITPPASPPRAGFTPTSVSPVCLNKGMHLDTPTTAEPMASSYLSDSPLPPSPPGSVSTLHSLIPQTVAVSSTPQDVESPPSTVSIRDDSIRDPAPTRALPACPPRATSPPLATSPTMEAESSLPAYRVESSPTMEAESSLPAYRAETSPTMEAESSLPAYRAETSPTMEAESSLPAYRAEISPTMEAEFSLPAYRAEISPTMKVESSMSAYRAKTPPITVTRFEPIPEDIQPSIELTLDTDLQRALSPPRTTSPTMESLPPLPSLAAGYSSSAIATCYEPILNFVTPGAEPSLYTDQPISHSPSVTVPPTSEYAISISNEPVPDDIKPSAESSLHTGLLRSASPPRATSPTMDSVYSLSSIATEAPHSAIAPSYDPSSNDITARDEQLVSASPPRATSPVFEAICSETLISLEEIPTEEPVSYENTHREGSVIFESHYMTVDSSPRHDARPDEMSMGLTKQPTALLETRVDDTETSTIRMSTTEDAHQSELFFCKDTFPNQDMDTLSAMLHALPLYTTLNCEGALTHSSHSEDLSKVPGYRHAEDSEPETKSPWEELDHSVPYAGATLPPEEPRVNGTRLNGIGGQEEEEAMQEEETGEKEAQGEPGSTPKLCAQAVYEYHAEVDDRLALDGGALFQPLDSRNEP